MQETMYNEHFDKAWELDIHVYIAIADVPFSNNILPFI
jgi:hypothetical protein